MPKTEPDPAAAAPPGGEMSQQLLPRNRTLEEEVSELKQEKRVLESKLRGYQTLGQLLQEAKQELRVYKEKNQDLLEQLTALTSSSGSSKGDAESPSQNQILQEGAQGDSKAGEEVDIKSQPTVDVQEEVTTEGTAGSNDREVELPHVAVEHVDKTTNTSINLQQATSNQRDDLLGSFEVTPALVTEPLNPMLKDEGKKAGPAAELPSFVAVWELSESLPDLRTELSSSSSSESSTGPSVSLSLSTLPSGDSPPRHRATHHHPKRVPSGGRSEAAADISRHVNHLAETLTSSVGMTEPSELAPTLAKISLDALRMERQLNVCHTLIENLTRENEDLKKRLQDGASKYQQDIPATRKETERLSEKAGTVEGHQRSTSAVMAQDWVHVEREADLQKQNSQAGPAMPERPTQLETQVENMASQIKQLQAKNDKWDRHCAQMKEEFERQIATSKQEMDSCYKKLSEKEEQDKKRTNDMDRILLAAKKRTDDMEMAKEEALNQLHSEHNRRKQAEQNMIAAVQRATMLGERLQALEAQQGPRERSVDTSAACGAGGHFGANVNNAELLTEIQVLKQQVTIYKDDFDNERRDRERCQNEKDTLETELQQSRLDLTAMQQQLNDCHKEITSLREENTQLEINLAVKREEARQLKEERRRSALTQQVVYQPPPARQFPPSPGPRWSCQRCTFENIPERSTCELCGKSRGRQPEWECPYCTCKNPSQHEECRICGRMRRTQVVDEQQLARERAGHRTLVSRGSVEVCDHQSQNRFPHLNMPSRQDDIVIDGVYTAKRN